MVVHEGRNWWAHAQIAIRMTSPKFLIFVDTETIAAFVYFHRIKNTYLSRSIYLIIYIVLWINSPTVWIGRKFAIIRYYHSYALKVHYTVWPPNLPIKKQTRDWSFTNQYICRFNGIFTWLNNKIYSYKLISLRFLLFF